MEANILDLKFESSDLEKEVTIREFFYHLLEALWIEKESFNSKRPFGNSDWDIDLIKCLIVNNFIEGEIDKEGYLVKYNRKKVQLFVIKTILKPMILSS